VLRAPWADVASGQAVVVVVSGRAAQVACEECGRSGTQGQNRSQHEPSRSRRGLLSGYTRGRAMLGEAEGSGRVGERRRTRSVTPMDAKLLREEDISRFAYHGAGHGICGCLVGLGCGLVSIGRRRLDERARPAAAIGLTTDRTGRVRPQKPARSTEISQHKQVNRPNMAKPTRVLHRWWRIVRLTGP
jgi:hypothetical protein